MSYEIKNTRIPIKIWANDLEPAALDQAINLSKVPVTVHHIALMADAHKGKGSTIGSVIALDKALIPSAVGVDIGCGMIALKLPFKIDLLYNPESCKALRHSFERSIPLGRNSNKTVSPRVVETFEQFGLPRIFKQENKKMRDALHQLGSLGGGNHFIELCYDGAGEAWVMIHSGSRHIGLLIAEKYIEKAINLKHLEVPDPLLSCLIEGSQEFDDYVHDLNWALKYAYANRHEMLLRVIKDISYQIYKDERMLEPETFKSYFHINCHHNFAVKETHFGQEVWVIRKGAISARANEWGIIPGSMGSESYIVKGKGNPESFYSSSHGAGRKMSRTEAFKQFTEDDVVNQTKGIECKKDRSVIDEIPAAYKDINGVMASQSDLVESVFKLKQILCVKGGKE